MPSSSCSSPRHDKALVTLAVGAHHRHLFETLCRENWSRYAARYGYDLIAFFDPLDQSARAGSRSPAWQKCLVLEQPEVRAYRQVVWIDSDILLNPETAPCVCTGVPEGRIGGVDAYGIPTRAHFTGILERLYGVWRQRGVRFVDNLTPERFYSNRGLAPLADVIHTGVMVASPALHAGLFRRAYDQYEEMGSAEWNYEMGFLSWVLVQAGVVHWLDPRFNMLLGDEITAHYSFLTRDVFAPFLLPEQRRTASERLNRHLMHLCIQQTFTNSWFLHFTGMQDLIPREDAMAMALTPVPGA